MRKFICSGCSGGCELITDSFDDIKYPELPECKNGCTAWKEIVTDEKTSAYD